MKRVFRLETVHQDLIHDVAYDFYGLRVATCSSDQRINVWDSSDQNSWELNDEWKAHDGSILKLAWSHPEYGTLIASASADRTVKIWEENIGESRAGSKRWIERVKLVDNRTAVQDIEFAPRHLGLKLATCSADGLIKIYEAMDVMNTSMWTMVDDIDVSEGTNTYHRERDGFYSFSWSTSRFHPAMFVVGCGQLHLAKIYQYHEGHRKWNVIAILEGHTDVVHDVAWAPNLGRSYHLIATASRDEKVRLFRFSSEKTGQINVELVATFVDHHAEVWRVEWNVMGTILTSSGDDGKVRLWKANFVNEWKCLSVLTADGHELS